MKNAAMKNVKGLVTVVALLSLPVGLLASKRQPDNAGARPGPVERGRYLVETIGCSDCHTPKKFGPSGMELDTTRLLSGHPEGSALPAPPAGKGPWIATFNTDLTAWSGPWGISYAFNLTPDENTGIGSWHEETFVKAIRTGRHMGVARPILPPMPWQMYKNLTDDDLKAIYAYLRSIPPVKNRVPEPTPPATAVAKASH
jgi:mono/diheme cytochrome c family protein